MAANLQGDFCTPAQVADAKANGTVLDCAYYNPTLGQGYCGNETRAFCEIESGSGSGAGDTNYNLYNKSDNSDLGHVNAYKAMNCLNAGEYGVEDHGSMQYDLKYNREARFYLTRQSTTCTTNCDDAANYTSTMTNVDPAAMTSMPTLQASIIAEKAVELFNDVDGGNFVTYFGASAGGAGATTSPKIDSVFLEGVGEVAFGSSASPTADPTIGMIDNEIQFENLNTCAMQPYGVTAVLYEFADGVQGSAAGGSATHGAGVAGNQVQIKNASVTLDDGTTQAHADLANGVLPPTGDIHNLDGSLGYVTFGTQTVDVDYTNTTPSTSTLRADQAGMDHPLYQQFTLQKTGANILVESTGAEPAEALGQNEVSFVSANAGDTRSTYGSPSAEVQAYAFDGCQKCSAYFYSDLATGNIIYPAFHNDCVANDIGLSGKTFVSVNAPKADGTTRAIKVCTDCDNATTTDGSNSTTTSVNFSTHRDTLNTQAVCSMTELIENNNFYTPP